MTKLPTFWYERRLWKKGHQVVVGLDEVGRGAWAGPLVVGAVSFQPVSDFVLRISEIESLGIDDSKRLRAKKREVLAEVIKGNALAWAVSEVPVSVINRLGMGKATQKGFRRAVHFLRKKLGEKKVDYVLIDAFYISRLAGLPRGRFRRPRLSHLSNLSNVRSGRQLAIVNGDQKSVSIAAASIIAKVYRDKLMQKLAKRYRLYGWGRNKGYGTVEHQIALKKHGLTRWHRKTFVETGLATGRRTHAGV